MAKSKGVSAGKPAVDKQKSEAVILDAAEACFAEMGFNGTSVRAIGEKAGLNPALVHYYFQSKELLFEEVVARRASAINQERREQLLVLFAEAAPSLPALEQVLDAIIRPTVKLGRDDSRGGRHYTSLINNLASAIDQRSLKIIADNYDPIARHSINSLMRVVEGLQLEDAVLAYLATIRVAFSLMAPTGRAKVLSDGLCDDYDVEGTIRFVVDFVAAGLRGIADTRRSKA
jgi:AcrR family transcriptional regulator